MNHPQKTLQRINGDKSLFLLLTCTFYICTCVKQSKLHVGSSETDFMDALRLCLPSEKQHRAQLQRLQSI